MKMKITKDLEVPRVPNYILVQDGLGEKLRLADLSSEQLDELADEWRKHLHNRAAQQRADPGLNLVTAP